MSHDFYLEYDLPSSHIKHPSQYQRVTEMMPSYLDRFAELYERQGRQVEIMNGKLWVNYGRLIIPIGPISKDYSISEEQAHQLMKMIPGSLMVRYSHNNNTNGCKEWYAIICDNFLELGGMRRKRRNEIRRGLKHCDIRQLDAAFIAKHGYDVYFPAFSRYQGTLKPIGIKEYKNMINATINFDDIYHYWGAFYQNKLVGYMVVALYGKEEADISVGKFIPEYLRYHPSDALVQTVVEYYLQNELISYLNSGYRNMYHKTSVQEYLLVKFNFKKSYLNLKVTYSTLLNYIIKMTFPLRGWLSKIHGDLGSIYMLEEIRKKCELADYYHRRDNLEEEEKCVS